MTSTAAPPTIARRHARDDPVLRTRLLVVDDHPAVRAGLHGLLADQVDFEVVAATESAEAAMIVAEREQIDVAVVDYILDGRNGLWLSRKLKRLAVPPAVLIYSNFTTGILPAAAVMAEADAIISKGKRERDLCEAIRRIAAGGRELPRLSPALTNSLRRRLDHEEQAIFGLLAAGIGRGEIAATLRLSEAGLESRLGQMLRRLESQPSASTP